MSLNIYISSLSLKFPIWKRELECTVVVLQRLVFVRHMKCSAHGNCSTHWGIHFSEKHEKQTDLTPSEITSNFLTEILKGQKYPLTYPIFSIIAKNSIFTFWISFPKCKLLPWGHCGKLWWWILTSNISTAIFTILCSKDSFPQWGSHCIFLSK